MAEFDESPNQEEETASTAVVALVGFSGVGKSYLARSFDGVDVIDTDDFIGKTYLQSSLRQLYFDLPAGADRQPVLGKIRAAEEQFLKEWSPRPGSRTIIAAGPAIPSSAALWKAFLDRTGAFVIHLKAKPALVEVRLLARYESEQSEHAGKPNAQAWNDGILTKKVGVAYEQLPKAEQQRNIARFVEMNDAHYARYADETYECSMLSVANGTTIKKFRASVQGRLGI